MATNLKRIGTDAAGYGLILLGITSGWLPGPGGIPLILGGLGLLSINNEWARRVRDWLVHHGGNFVQKLFPKHPFAQALYDLLALLLLGLVAFLAYHHAVIWQISLATVLFFVALLIAGMNRDRYTRLRQKVSR
jgi:hypothetical protein